jgi:hypothetical protein
VAKKPMPQSTTQRHSAISQFHHSKSYKVSQNMQPSVNGNSHFELDPLVGEGEFYREVTEELLDELVETFEEERVVGLALWDESIADEEGAEIDPDQRDVFDMDLYTENQLYFELFAVYAFTDPDSEPLRGLDQIGKMFSELIESGLWLDEIATTEDNELVLILSQNRQPKLYLNVGGWSIAEWDELPDEDA